jgi:hypothetical protein
LLNSIALSRSFIAAEVIFSLLSHVKNT